MADDKLRIERIEAKIDVIDERLQETNITLVAQHESLKTHIHRTELLEEAVVPLQRRSDQLIGALKLLGLLAAIASIIELIRYFK